MGSPEIEHFADSIPNDNTYMSQICSKIFTISNSTMTSPELSSVVDAACQDWFLQALDHCTETILAPSETSFHTWLFHKMLNIRFLIFPKRPVTSLASTHPHIKVNPSMLKKSECNQLFLEVAKDYIDIAPKYSICVEESFFLFSIFRGLLGLLVLFLLFVYIKKFVKRHKKRLAIRRLSKPSAQCEAENKVLETMSLISIYSLRTQRIDKKHLRVLPDLYHAPTVAISVKKNRLSEALCCLIKSEPVIEQLRNGVLVKPINKDRRYVLHKINGYLNRTAKCRVILELDLESSDSEEETKSEKARSVQPSLSGGDFNSARIYDNTPEESTVESSSACSGIYSTKGRLYKQEQYQSVRQRQTYSGTGSKHLKNLKIRKGSPHAGCLIRNDSSNSVVIVPKGPTASLKKSSNCSTGKGRGVRISRL